MGRVLGFLGHPYPLVVGLLPWACVWLDHHLLKLRAGSPGALELVNR